MAGGSVGVGAVAGGAASAVAVGVDVTSAVMEAAPVAGAEVGMAVHWVEGRPGVAC
jgi:putative NIF3 family GTP cyclohydrolase 1 type 2